MIYDTTPESLARASTVFYGSKDGYSNSRTQQIQNYGSAVHLADIDRDGRLEALFSDQRDFILVYKGIEEGFSPERSYRIPCPVPGALDSADLDQDGWLDLIVSHASHYTGRPESLSIFYSQAGEFSPEHSETYKRGITMHGTAVADFNRDGHLDVVSAPYSSPTTRVLPATLHWGDGRRVDLT